MRTPGMRRVVNSALVFCFALSLGLLLSASIAGAAYHHEGEIDSDQFLQIHPEKAGTKLDSCALCHTGGSYEKFPDSGKFVTVGSCQWCHRVYGYDGSGDLLETLNPYGRDYLDAGRSPSAVELIAQLDSDEDGYPNQDEIAADSFPGNPNDDPSKKPAPARVFSLEELKNLPLHTQFQVMNTHKSGDYYATYGGVTVENLLKAACALDDADGVTVYSPDGYSQFHPMDPTLASPNTLYPILGEYPPATYFYDEQADQAISDVGWCDYSAPGNAAYRPGDTIQVDGGLRCLLAFLRDGDLLTPGVLTTDNKLDGEGPFRLVPPQTEVNPPDQGSTSPDQDVIWPFTDPWDHNAGFSTRSVTIIRVEPLPAGTTDVDLLEAGWEYVDGSKVLVYGALDDTSCTLHTRSGPVRVIPAAGTLAEAEWNPLEGEPQGVPGEMATPYGMLRYRIRDLALGETVAVTLEFPDPVSDDAALYKLGSDGVWRALPFTRGERPGILVVELTDGDPATDADQTVNGAISDPVTLAETAPTGGGSSGGGSGGCMLNPNAGFGLEWLLLIGGAAVLFLRRRRG